MKYPLDLSLGTGRKFYTPSVVESQQYYDMHESTGAGIISSSTVDDTIEENTGECCDDLITCEVQRGVLQEENKELEDANTELENENAELKAQAIDPEDPVYESIGTTGNRVTSFTHIFDYGSSDGDIISDVWKYEIWVSGIGANYCVINVRKTAISRTIPYYPQQSGIEMITPTGGTANSAEFIQHASSGALFQAGNVYTFNAEFVGARNFIGDVSGPSSTRLAFTLTINETPSGAIDPDYPYITISVGGGGVINHITGNRKP